MNKPLEPSKNFNEKLFTEIKRTHLVKNIINITIIGFFKALLSILEVLRIPGATAKKDQKK
jgi:hypothetical protein